MVLEVPPKFLGTIDAHWFRWVVDIGPSGPDRAEGGRYLIVPPDYTGSLPDGGFFVARACSLVRVSAPRPKPLLVILTIHCGSSSPRCSEGDSYRTVARADNMTAALILAARG